MTDLAETIKILPGYDPYQQSGDAVFRPRAAQRVIDFVEQCCTHVKGPLAGGPLLLERWQKALLANLYGWFTPGGYRRYREALVFIPRGNSKTTLAAAIVNIHLFLEHEKGAELYSAAAEREQARLCFDIVSGMIRNEKMMSQRAELYKYSIVVGDKSYKALSAEAGSKHGFNAQLIVNDELHAHRTPELTEVLMTSQGKRLQPLCVHLSTSDWERAGSVCNSKHDWALKVRDGVITDPAFLPVVYEASKTDDWTAPETWEKANPNLDISIPREYVVRECQRAQDDPAYENTFKRLQLNIRTEAVDRWINTSDWDQCWADIRLADFRGELAFAGLDLASTQDFNAFAVVFKQEELFCVFPFFWVPRRTAIKNEREHGIPYSVWESQGFLTCTDGETYQDVSDPKKIHEDINKLVEEHQLNIQEIAVDRAFQGLDLMRRLEADGYLAFAHGQGSLGMIPPTKVTKDAILGNRLRHNGNPVLRWMMSNVVVKPGEGFEHPMRNKSSGKIDGVVAMIMAVGRADAFQEAQLQESYYEAHALLD